MAFILVVLQLVTIGNGRTWQGFTPIGEFTSEAQCNSAIQQLSNMEMTNDKQFICLKK